VSAETTTVTVALGGRIIQSDMEAIWPFLEEQFEFDDCPKNIGEFHDQLRECQGEWSASFSAVPHGVMDIELSEDLVELESVLVERRIAYRYVVEPNYEISGLSTRFVPEPNEKDDYYLTLGERGETIYRCDLQKYFADGWSLAEVLAYFDKHNEPLPSVTFVEGYDL